MRLIEGCGSSVLSFPNACSKRNMNISGIWRVRKVGEIHRWIPPRRGFRMPCEAEVFVGGQSVVRSLLVTRGRVTRRSPPGEKVWPLVTPIPPVAFGALVPTAEGQSAVGRDSSGSGHAKTPEVYTTRASQLPTPRDQFAACPVGAAPNLRAQLGSEPADLRSDRLGALLAGP